MPEEIKIPEKFKEIVETIEKMSVIEIAELVKILEEKFGVSAASMVAVSPAVAGGESGAAVAEKTTFAVELKSAGEQKVQVIKVIKEATGLGLKEAKDIVDGAPKIIKDNLKKEEAEELKKKIEEAGGVAELK